MARRGAHEGNIRERKDGRWEARYRTSDGRQHSMYGPTYNIVRDRLRAALTAADNGIRPVDGRLTTGAWLDEWLTTSVHPRLRPTTADNYATIVRPYLKPELGRIPLAKLTPEHIGAMLGRIAAKGKRGTLSPTTVRYVYVVLRIALGRALKTGKVVRNVAVLVDPPAKTRTEMRPLTSDQVGTLFEATRSDRLAALWVTAVGLGMRKGELLALRWSDVDLDGGVLAVRHSLRRGELAEPKTERGRRTLVLPKMVTETLREHRRRQLEDRLAAGPGWRDRDFVFATSIGTPLDPRNVTRMFEAAIERAGLPHQRFHDLRHACATLLVEQGEDLAVVSRILGHANLSTTADVYAHLTRGMQDRAAERMDAVLRRSEVG